MDRENLVKETWQRVNNIAQTSEDEKQIRVIITTADITPNIHVGTDSNLFTDLMTGEWILGQWAACIDASSPFLNSMRNLSLIKYEETYGSSD